MKKIVFIILCLMSTQIFAQDREEAFQKQFEDMMKAREEMFNSLLDDQSMGGIEKRMLDMMKRFSTPGFDDMEGAVVGEYNWIDTDTQKILKLKVKQIKDKPLDIKIEKGMVNIKGEVESVQGSGKSKVVSRTQFQRGFSIPSDVDQTNPEFENKDGELLIKFKRLAISRKQDSKSINRTQVTPVTPDRTPVSPDQNDLSI